MSIYIRNRIAGGTYFFTVVTRGRQPILCDEPVRRALRVAVDTVRAEHPFRVVAWVLLPDHLHCVWELPTGDAEYSMRWRAIKRRATRAAGLGALDAAANRLDGRLWQRRFWEHTICDEADLMRHVDYIHWNPVKHGLVSEVAEWPFSTFHRYVRQGLYPRSWAGGVGPSMDDEVPE